jgi:molybdenum cofactor biosynthesis enzyme MoaA
MSFDQAVETINTWAAEGLKNIRFSGGEPLLWKRLPELVTFTRARGVERVAISSNGSLPLTKYTDLVYRGANDFSISLDACRAADCGKMSGTKGNLWPNVITTIQTLSAITYVTVGVVLTDANAHHLGDIVTHAHDLGVADIRIIPAAQEGNMVRGVETIPQEIVDAHPILKYRVANLLQGKTVRGIQEYDSHRCYIPWDDSAVAGGYHFPCVIYMREQGDPIGKVGPNMRQERIEWTETHNSFEDPICRTNCLDVCIDHNNKCAACRGCTKVGQ